MVTRTWACLNRHCQLVFDEQLDNPACPRCGGIHTKWQPRPFGIMKATTKFATRTAEKLAQDYGLTNFHTPEFGRPAIMTDSPVRTSQALNVQQAVNARNESIRQEQEAASATQGLASAGSGSVGGRVPEIRSNHGHVDYIAKDMPNWKAKLPVDDQGRVMAACVPTGVTAKLSGNVAQSGDKIEVSGGRAATHSDLSGGGGSK